MRSVRIATYNVHKCQGMDGRTRPERIARVLFTVFDGEAVLLHGFIKKSQKTPAADLDTAIARMRTLNAAHKRAKQ